ncbi:MAG: Bax inhibitor-1/YccA family protein [Gammaproteobacteria bacterium]|nr:Bax inhibitor-1/YccA family protein [Gammaproteobacteria bacterium]
MNPVQTTIASTRSASLATNKLIRNTYILLSMTLLFSAAVAATALTLRLPAPGFLLTLVGFFGLFFLTAKLRDSSWGLAAVFALTGFMGYTLGPIVGHYLHLPNGGQVVMMAMAATGVTFLALSAYALTTRKDFSFMGGALFAGLIVAILMSLGAWLFEIPAMALAVSAMMVLLMAGYILFDTSRMVHGGETNYIMATIGLYVSIYNLFLSLLQLLGVFGGDD